MEKVTIKEFKIEVYELLVKATEGMTKEEEVYFRFNLRWVLDMAASKVKQYPDIEPVTAMMAVLEAYEIVKDTEYTEEEFDIEIKKKIEELSKVTV